MRAFYFAVFVVVLVLVAGCSSFNLGSVLYCAHGQNCDLKTETPAKAGAVAKGASAP